MAESTRSTTGFARALALNERPWHEPNPAGQTKRLSFVPMLGLLQQPLLWFLEMAPLTFELQIAPTTEECFTRDTDTGTWQTVDPYILCDALHLDPCFCQQCSSSILAGTPLSYHFTEQVP